MNDLTTLRHWYAEDLALRTPVRNRSVVEAFAAVPRERFLGPGPWQILPLSRPDQPFTTPDAAPHWLYHDVLVAIDPARHLNNGMPSFWAHNFDRLDLTPGERVLQVGAGTGYYSAILAEMVGPQGRVVAIEHDAELAARAGVNLAQWGWVEAVAGDGRTHDDQSTAGSHGRRSRHHRVAHGQRQDSRPQARHSNDVAGCIAGAPAADRPQEGL